MTHEEYKQQLTTWAGLTEKRLAALCDEYLPQQSELGQAARYSLLGGGKRVRAVLTLDDGREVLAQCPSADRAQGEIGERVLLSWNPGEAPVVR